eukprot:7282025-Prymnesium_polylepis.2
MSAVSFMRWLFGPFFVHLSAFPCIISPLRKAGRPASAYGAFSCSEPPFRLCDPRSCAAHALPRRLPRRAGHANGLPWRVTHRRA